MRQNYNFFPTYANIYDILGEIHKKNRRKAYFSCDFF